jgi:hypothetical protein
VTKEAGVKSLSVITAAALACTGAAFGQAFLTLHPGIDHAAMAGANTALAWDADAPFYNPAGTAFLSGINAALGISRIQRFEQTGFWNGAASFGFGRRLAVGGFADGIRYPYSDSGYSGGRFTQRQIGVNLAWAPIRWVSIGVNGKYLTETLLYEGEISDYEAASAIAADLGLLGRYPTRAGEFCAGGSLANLGTEMDWSDPEMHDYELLQTARAGVGWVLHMNDVRPEAGFGPGFDGLFGAEWMRENWRLCLTFDRTWYWGGTADRVQENSLGAELRPVPCLVLRGGWFYSGARYTYNVRKGWTWGAGLDLRYVRFDIGSDDAMYYTQPTKRWLKWSVSLNLGEPLVHL